MAFLAQQPRRSTQSQLSRSASNASLSKSTQSNRRGDVSGLLSDRNEQDWSVVFPGRSTVNRRKGSNGLQSTSESTSPFVSSPDDREVDQSNVELTLPHDQDGTGRFTRPSSPSYAADDEDEEDETQSAAQLNGNEMIIPSITVPSMHDSESNNSDLDNDSELDALEITSSILISGSETGRRDSSASHRRRRLSEWENGSGANSALSSSWAWMNAEGSTISRRGRERLGRGTDILPVVFTSGSEGEGEESKARRSCRSEDDEAAFEEALANTHTAQSAGLIPRAPKRRHRKNGESAKGSKRSNSSAIPGSDMQISRRSALLRSRRGNLSVSNRSGSRGRYLEKGKGTINTSQSIVPESQGVLKAILRRIFQVDDEEVLQAFLRDEGPLQVEEVHHSTLAIEASTALKMSSSSFGYKDDVWTRNERMRQLRRSHLVVEETANEEEEEEEEEKEVKKIIHERSPMLSASSSDIFAAPHRVRLQSNVGEPTLLEALQATVLSSLATVPSGFSILLAGSRSARLVNYLAGRLVGQIGPNFTERVRKLIDDAEDDTSIQDEIFGSETRSTTSSTRFRGSSHPAISSKSSSTLSSN